MLIAEQKDLELYWKQTKDLFSQSDCNKFVVYEDLENFTNSIKKTFKAIVFRHSRLNFNFQFQFFSAKQVYNKFATKWNDNNGYAYEKSKNSLQGSRRRL